MAKKFRWASKEERDYYFIMEAYRNAIGSIEVKTERGIWKKTGNIAVEISYRGNPSGISNTDAKWWIHVLNDDGVIDSAMIFDVATLRKKIKDMIKSGDARVITAGDRLDSEIVLIPIDKLSITGVDNER